MQPEPEKPLRIRCVTDQLGNVAVYDIGTGARLWGVQSVTIQASTGKAPTAIIRVVNVEIEMVARVATITPVAGSG